MGTKITISDLSTLDATALAPLNTALDDLADEFDKVVYRDGTTPSQMTASLDMNSNTISNLAAPVDDNDAARKSDILDKRLAPRLDTNNQTGTSYTLALADEGKVVEMNNASANTVTVPPNSSVAFPDGVQVTVWQQGAGQTTVAEGSGVTVRTAETLKLRSQYSAATLVKRDTDEWWLTGDLEAA